MNLTTTRWMAALTAGSLAITMTACGGDDDDETSDSEPEIVEEEPVDTADDSDNADPDDEAADVDDADSDGSDDADAEDAEAVDTEDASGAGEAVDITEFIERLQAPGDEVLGSYEIQMDMTAAGQEMAVSGMADLRGDDPAMDLSMDGGAAGQMDLLLVGGEMYMSIAGVTEEGQYVAISADELGLAGANDPTQSIDLQDTWNAWEQGAQSVEFIGAEDVDGEEMDRYTITVDSETALEATGQEAVAGMPDTIVYDVWVNGDDLMRLITFEFPGVTTEMTASNWGADFDIQAPDPADVVDMAEVMGSAGG